MQQLHYSAVVLTLSLLITITSGCATTHKPVRSIKAGQILPVYVQLGDTKPPATGQVHYRQPAEAQFNAMQMNARSDGLYALLPTASLPAGIDLLYYIDVQQGEKNFAHGAPDKPYVVHVLDPLQWATEQVKLSIEGDLAFAPLIIHVTTGELDVDTITLLYTIPGVVGEISAPMQRVGDSHWILKVPPPSVHPGPWSYAMVLNTTAGQTLRIPGAGSRQFVIKQPKAIKPRDTRAPGDRHQKPD